MNKEPNRVPLSPCVSCGHPNDSSTPLRKDHTPSSGDISICLYCGHIAAFAEDLTLRALTSAEICEVAGSPEILFAQKVRGEYERRYKK